MLEAYARIFVYVNVAMPITCVDSFVEQYLSCYFAKRWHVLCLKGYQTQFDTATRIHS